LRLDDEEGTELADVAAAEAEALESAIEVICQRLESGWVQRGRNVLAGGVEVTDEAGALLLTLPFATVLKNSGSS
jgi:hypothetical protein